METVVIFIAALAHVIFGVSLFLFILTFAYTVHYEGSLQQKLDIAARGYTRVWHWPRFFVVVCISAAYLFAWYVT